MMREEMEVGWLFVGLGRSSSEVMGSMFDMVVLERIDAV